MKNIILVLTAFAILVLGQNCFADDNSQYYKINFTNQTYKLEFVTKVIDSDYTKIDDLEKQKLQVVRNFDLGDYTLISVADRVELKKNQSMLTIYLSDDKNMHMFLVPKNIKKAFEVVISGNGISTDNSLEAYTFSSTNKYFGDTYRIEKDLSKNPNGTFTLENNNKTIHKEIKILDPSSIEINTLTFYKPSVSHTINSAYKINKKGDYIIFRRNPLKQYYGDFDLYLISKNNIKQLRVEDMTYMSDGGTTDITTSDGDHIFLPANISGKSLKLDTFNDKPMKKIEVTDKKILGQLEIKSSIQNFITPFYPVSEK